MGRIEYLTHTSDVLQDNPLGDPTERQLPVYLPDGYDTSDQPYPVIWVLAPFTSWGERHFNLKAWDENIIQRMDRLVVAGEAAPTILAFPDCFTALGGSQYLNSSAVGRYEDYLFDELIPFLDDAVRTIPEKRGVMGYSSGGFAALYHAMSHPEHFQAAASHAGDMYFEYCYQPDIPAAIRAIERYDGVQGVIDHIGDREAGGSDFFSAVNLIAMSACYSPSPESTLGFDLPFDLYTGQIIPSVWERWQAVDPVRMAPNFLDTLGALDLLYFDCGAQDEYNLFLGARLLHQLLEDVEHTYEEFKGSHRRLNWRYETSLPLITKALQE